MRLVRPLAIRNANIPRKSSWSAPRIMTSGQIQFHLYHFLHYQLLNVHVDVDVDQTQLDSASESKKNEPINVDRCLFPVQF